MHHLVFNQQISLWHKVVFWNFRRGTCYWPVRCGPALRDRSPLGSWQLSCQAHWNFSSSVGARSENLGTTTAGVRAALCKRGTALTSWDLGHPAAPRFWLGEGRHWQAAFVQIEEYHSRQRKPHDEKLRWKGTNDIYGTECQSIYWECMVQARKGEGWGCLDFQQNILIF